MTGAPPPGRAVPGNRWDLLDGVVPARPPLVSVVVVHFRQPAQLERTLAALARQTHPADRLEVLVVDDGSPEPPRVPPGVVLLRQEDRGFRAAAARNLGARHARGEVLCFLDADTVPEPECVARLTRLPALAPEAVTVGRREHADLSRIPADAPVEVAAPAVALPAPAWLREGYANSGDLLRADHRSYRFVISAVMACSRWFHDEVGGFDEALGAYGGEDWEWGHRAWLAGAVLAHVPDAVAWHDGPDWSARPEGEQARRAAKNQEAMRLAAAIPVPGSRPRALRGGRADVVVRLPATASETAAYLCVDAVLAELPEARVEVGAGVAATFAADPRVVASPANPDPRGAGASVVVELARAVRVAPGGLREAVARVAPGTIAGVELTAADGSVLARIRSARAAARTMCWGACEGFETLQERALGLEPVSGEPDLEAWFGGWG